MFALYTADCKSTDESCPLAKFADDTELVEKISNDADAIYHKQIENFVNWCYKNYLYLNVSKTKEMCTDFRKNQRCPKPVYIKGEAVESVDTYKYLGVVFDSKLNWKEIKSVLKKVNSRIYCMTKLRSFGVNSDMLVTFYNAVICSIIMFGSVCWGGNISKLDRGRLEKIVKKAGHVVGKPVDSFQTLHEKRLYRKTNANINDPTHPMRHYFDSRPSNKSGRFLLPRIISNRYKASFFENNFKTL